MGRKRKKRTTNICRKKCDKCLLCKKLRMLTKHHLFPRCYHKDQEYIVRHGLSKMRNHKIFVCKFCHKGIHSIFSNKQLIDEFNTLESIISNKDFKNHIESSKTQMQYDISQRKADNINRKSKIYSKKKSNKRKIKNKILKQIELMKTFDVQ